MRLLFLSFFFFNEKNKRLPGWHDWYISRMRCAAAHICCIMLMASSARNAFYIRKISVLRGDLTGESAGFDALLRTPAASCWWPVLLGTGTKQPRGGRYQSWRRTVWNLLCYCHRARLAWILADWWPFVGRMLPCVHVSIITTFSKIKRNHFGYFAPVRMFGIIQTS